MATYTGHNPFEETDDENTVQQVNLSDSFHQMDPPQGPRQPTHHAPHAPTALPSVPPPKPPRPASQQVETHEVHQQHTTIIMDNPNEQPQDDFAHTEAPSHPSTVHTTSHTQHHSRTETTLSSGEEKKKSRFSVKNALHKFVPSHEDEQFDFELSEDGIQQKEKHLKQREMLLNQREGLLLEKERSIPKLNPRPANFPPCFCWKVKPILFHDIEADIRIPEVQSVVKKGYYSWYFICAFFIWNIIAIFAALISTGDTNFIRGFAMSIAFAFAFIPLTFMVYRLLYNAGRKSRPRLYVIWSLFQFLLLLMYIFLLIGLGQWGGAGLFTMFRTFLDGDFVSGVVCLIAAICWGTTVCWTLYYFYPVYKVYRMNGGLKSLDSAQETEETAEEDM